MKTIERKTAIALLSSIAMKDLSREKRASLLLDWWSLDEEDEEFHVLPPLLQDEILSAEEPLNPEKEYYNPLLEIAISASYKGIKNSYLAKALQELFGDTFEVVGEVERLLPCPCCGYRTLQERGQYEICPVCSWEDDGNNVLEKYSSCNRSTLKEAMSNLNNSLYSSASEKYLT